MAEANVFRGIFFVMTFFHHRSCERFPETLAGRYRPPGPGLLTLPVRLHHLGGPGHLLDLLPRSPPPEGLKNGRTQSRPRTEENGIRAPSPRREEANPLEPDPGLLRHSPTSLAPPSPLLTPPPNSAKPGAVSTATHPHAPTAPQTAALQPRPNPPSARTTPSGSHAITRK